MLFGWLFSHCVWLDAYINLNFKKMTSQDRYFEHVIGTVTSSGPSRSGSWHLFEQLLGTV